MSEITPARKLFDLLVTRDFDPEMLDTQGKPAADPAETDIFSFDFRAESGKNYGTIVIMLGDDKDLEVYCADNVGRSMEGSDKDDWFAFLEQLKNFATRNFMSFGIKNLNRLRYSMQGQAAIKEGLFEGYYGTRKVSYMGEQTQARLVINHNRVLGENDKRFRYVESLYIETADQERFRLTFKNLAGGRAMLEHVRQGGRPYDARGNHIVEIVSEMAVLSRFNRAQHRRVFEGVTQQLVESAREYYANLQETLKHLGSPRGYQGYFESWAPDHIGEAEALVENLRDLFVEQTLDARIEAALPTLAKIQQGTKMKEAKIFENWVDQISEGTWALPDTPEAQEKLNELMASELIVGPDATNATEQLYDVIGDDHLFDILNDLADRDPRANIWDDSDVQARLAELGIQTPQSTAEEPSDVEQDTAPELNEEGEFSMDNPGRLSNQEYKDALNRSYGQPDLDTSRMNQQTRDFYDKNPSFKQSGREIVTPGDGRLASKVVPAVTDTKVGRIRMNTPGGSGRAGGGMSGPMGGMKPGQSPSLDNPINNEDELAEMLRHAGIKEAGVFSTPDYSQSAVSGTSTPATSTITTPTIDTTPEPAPTPATSGGLRGNFSTASDGGVAKDPTQAANPMSGVKSAAVTTPTASTTTTNTANKSGSPMAGIKTATQNPVAAAPTSNFKTRTDAEIGDTNPRTGVVTPGSYDARMAQGQKNLDAVKGFFNKLTGKPAAPAANPGTPAAGSAFNQGAKAVAEANELYAMLKNAGMLTEDSEQKLITKVTGPGQTSTSSTTGRISATLDKGRVTVKPADADVKEGSNQGGVWSASPPKAGQPSIKAPSGDPEGAPSTPRTASPGWGKDYKPLIPDTTKGSAMGINKGGVFQADPKGTIKAPGGDPESVKETRQVNELDAATIQSAAAQRDTQTSAQMSPAAQRRDPMVGLTNRINMNTRLPEDDADPFSDPFFTSKSQSDSAIHAQLKTDLAQGKGTSLKAMNPIDRDQYLKNTGRTWDEKTQRSVPAVKTTTPITTNEADPRWSRDRGTDLPPLEGGVALGGGGGSTGSWGGLRSSFNRAKDISKELSGSGAGFNPATAGSFNRPTTQPTTTQAAPLGGLQSTQPGALRVGTSDRPPTVTSAGSTPKLPDNYERPAVMRGRNDPNFKADFDKTAKPKITVKPGESMKDAIQRTQTEKEFSDFLKGQSGQQFGTKSSPPADKNTTPRPNAPGGVYKSTLPDAGDIIPDAGEFYPESKNMPDAIDESLDSLRDVLRNSGVAVNEGVLTDSTGSTLDHIIDTFKRDVKDFTQTGEMSDALYDVLYDYYFDDMPYGTRKARTGDPGEWISDRFAQDIGIDESHMAPRPTPMAECNYTMEGEYCPEHGLAECGGMALGMGEGMSRLKELAGVETHPVPLPTDIQGTDLDSLDSEPFKVEIRGFGPEPDEFGPKPGSSQLAFPRGHEVDEGIDFKPQEGDALLARIKSLALLR